MQSQPERKPTISLRLPPKLVREIDALAARARMKSRTEFFERAIEAYVRELSESKVIAVKRWTEARAKAAIVKHLRRTPSAYVSDIAEALGMDFDLAFRTVDRLMEEGAVGRTP